MNCPNCGNEINENQKFCSNCGQAVGDNANLPWIKQHFKEIIIFSLAVFFLVVCGALALNNNNIPAQTDKTVVADTEVAEDGGYENPEDMGCGDGLEETQQLTNLPRNCIYETSDGVCFTTEVFSPKPLIVGDKGNYWVGAKEACESQGYKLPSDYDLRSLFSDILSIQVKSGMNIQTTKFMTNSDIPNNYTPAQKIAPKGFHNYGTKWDDITLWEDSDFDNDRAYMRRYSNSDTTFQYIEEKIKYHFEPIPKTICVYDPNGKPHKSFIEEQNEKTKREAQAEKERKMQQKQEQLKNEAENELF